MANDPILRIDQSASAQSGAADVDPSLPEPVRDHLGQQLRSVFTTQDDAPKFLGEPAVPEEFAPQLRRLETRLKTHEEGTGAVEQALDGLLDDLKAPPATTI
ncbi:hypothetical protein [Methylobacterium sp. Leaf93]|uniref:hypothetical protein n=1 Tax=Methylobacterium sp. Leaf93 TaxID=1736249 RepID=UPI0006FC7C56|nr:hypothetical protein [Methylobacterium sp. Leaf93]KQP08552.1 hypothetical protein ASF26_21180 [Methylobacterium sp. Leaf93]